MATCVYSQPASNGDSLVLHDTYYLRAAIVRLEGSGVHLIVVQRPLSLDIRRKLAKFLYGDRCYAL